MAQVTFSFSRPRRVSATITSFEALQGLQGMAAVADDMLVYGNSSSEHDEHLEKLLQRCQEKGILLNKAKTVYKKQSAMVFSHYLSNEGLQADRQQQKSSRTCQVQQTRKELKESWAWRIISTNARQSYYTAPMRDVVKKNIF